MVLRRAAEVYRQAAEAARQQQAALSTYAPEAPPRAVRRAEPVPNEEQRTPRPQPIALRPVQPSPKGTRRAEIVAALASPAGVRQALILQEILGPPKALQGPDDD